MNSYQIFKQLEEKEKRIKQYKSLDKEELIDTIDELNSKNENLQERIDKAIEYNKKILKENWYGGYEKENATKNINILQGEDK